jgi:hypothetical protein
MTRRRAKLTSVMVGDDSLLAQTAPSAQASSAGLTSSRIVAVARPSCGSIRVMVLSSPLATQTAPPPTQMPLGPLPTGMVLTAWFVAGEIHETVPSRLLTTHTVG